MDDETRAELESVRFGLQGILGSIERLLARDGADAVGSTPMSLVECPHPEDQRVSVAAMGSASAYLCRRCGSEVE